MRLDRFIRTPFFFDRIARSIESSGRWRMDSRVVLCTSCHRAVYGITSAYVANNSVVHGRNLQRCTLRGSVRDFPGKCATISQILIDRTYSVAFWRRTPIRTSLGTRASVLLIRQWKLNYNFTITALWNISMPHLAVLHTHSYIT